MSSVRPTVSLSVDVMQYKIEIEFDSELFDN